MIHWLRQIHGIILGLVYGVAKITGSVGFTSFFAVCIVGPTAVLKQFHEFDEDEIAKVGTIATEGLLPAFALFLLTWIVAYTTFLK